VEFGATTQQVQNQLGLPDETENLDQSTTLWCYKLLKLEIAFQSADWPSADMEKHVVQFVTRHPAITLWGEQIIGRHEAEVLGIFREHGFGSPSVSEEAIGQFSFKTFRFQNLSVVLDFRDGLLRSVLCRDPKSADGNRAADGSAVPRKR
jgi:hypothetical protein